MSKATAKAAESAVPKSLTEDQAAQAMWAHYLVHKAELMPEIGTHRGPIIAELMRGSAIDDVFAAYAKQPDPPPPSRRAR